MGSLRTPVGPLPSSIYWRRRAVVLLLIALILLLVFWALRSGGGGGDDDPAGHDDGAGGGPAESITPGPTPSESLIDERPGGRDESPSDDDTEDGSGDTEGANGDGGTGTEATDPGVGGADTGGGAAAGTGGGGLDPAALSECVPAAVSLSLSSDANDYAPGEEPELLLTVENTSDTACRVDFGHEALTVTVADRADDQVWSSDDCPTGAGSIPAAVPANGTATHTVTWDRRHSTQDCDGGAGPEAAGGTYLAEAELAGHPVVQTPFSLDED
ncbi:hypothetical protein [Streptomyces litchfieldiae]|uniref:DUF4232 domain-containing protein n=1 Tax=Streptomyces litchfieldiae TaxID=3075543 RepID=A0ABU2MK13_9ACTN|nr:hypothetical protein [Streptomyces sp. DSM 44938]MDT0341713.1 hypothetical protein [Streptomyces sp. DSM 44938]